MKAIQVREFGNPDVMKLEDVADPTPGAGEVLIRVKAAGINPVDVGLRSGMHPRSKLLALPWTPGIDAAGEVISVGPGVEGLEAGDRVFGSASGGSYAEQAVLAANRTAKLPAHLSFEEGGSFPVVLYTAHYAVVHRGGVRAGETVLIQAGAGGVGSMAIQIAKAAGARVLTTVSSQEKADFCRSLGADVTINYREEDFAARCLAETDGLGVDVVIEPVASENFDKDCEALRTFGRLVILGAGTGKSLTGSVTYPPFYSKDIDVLGFSLFNADAVFPHMLRQVNRLLEQGLVKAAVGETIPLAEAARAHDLLMTGKIFGKIVLTA